MTRINGHITMCGATRRPVGEEDPFLASWRGSDGPESVKKCLNCTKAECDNCIDGPHSAYGENGRPRRYDHGVIISYIRGGMAPCHIARIVGCHPSVVTRIRKKISKEEQI